METRGHRVRAVAIVLAGLLFLGATTGIQNLDVQNIRERMVLWALDKAVRFASSKFLSPTEAHHSRPAN